MFIPVWFLVLFFGSGLMLVWHILRIVVTLERDKNEAEANLVFLQVLINKAIEESEKDE